MAVDAGPGRNAQGGVFGHQYADVISDVIDYDAGINNNVGLVGSPVGVGGDDVTAVEISILPISHQAHQLVIAVGAEVQLVFHQKVLGVDRSAVVAERGTHQHQQAVVAADSDTIYCGPEVAVDKQGVGSTSRTGQAYVGFHRAAVAVVHPQPLRDGAHGGKYRVEHHCVGPQLQAARGLQQVFLGLAAR